MTTETQTAPTEKKADLPNIDLAGLKAELSVPKQNMVEEVKDAQSVAPKAPEKTVFFAGKKFSDLDELANYTAKLEKEKRELETKPASTKESSSKKDHFTSFVEDPEKFVTELKTEVTSEISQRYEAQERQKKIWSKFYEEFPDLRGHEDLVELSQARVWDQVKDRPVSDGLAEIAKATRQRIAGIRGKSFDGTRELSSGTAVATPVGSTSGSQVAVKVENKDFVTQLRALQKRQRG